MQYEIELHPLQILLNLEIFAKINTNLGINIEKKLIESAKKSINIISVDEKKKKTTISKQNNLGNISVEISKRIRDYMDNLYLINNIYPIYDKILNLSDKNQRKKHDYSTFLQLYIDETINTFLIDTLSNNIADLLSYIIKIALRKEKNTNKESIGNFLLNSLNDYDLERKIHIIDTNLNGEYWTSSRHLDLVTNDKITCNQVRLRYKNDNLPQKEKISKQKVFNWINKKIPKQLYDLFIEYSKYMDILLELKEIDAQIQIRSAFLLKEFLNLFHLKDMKKINSKNQDILNKFILELLANV